MTPKISQQSLSSDAGGSTATELSSDAVSQQQQGGGSPTTKPQQSSNPFDKEGGQQCLQWCKANNEQDPDMARYVDKHNEYRKAHQVEPPMTWDQDAYCYARCSPKRCTSYNNGGGGAHDDSGPFMKYAQSLAWNYNVADGMEMWYAEGSGGECDYKGRETSACGHFDNIMAFTQLGCHWVPCAAGVGDGTVPDGQGELRCDYGGTYSGGGNA